jgi:dihydropteroate synthase
MIRSRHNLRLRTWSFDLDERPLVMGILNVTPDSFFDGGKFAGRDAALRRLHEMVKEGAAIVDVGAQSYAATNPRVAEDEELRRLIPILEAVIAEKPPVAISVDTYRARVAREALALGADLINDCSGLSDERLAPTVAEFDAALVVMHLKGDLNLRDPQAYRYDDPIAEIAEFLRDRAAGAQGAGVRYESLILDPGLEFGKEPATDLEILRRFGELEAIGYPLLLAASRKSFIRRVMDLPFDELLAPSLAAAALGWYGGARLFRVHDVRETARFLKMLAATTAERPLSSPA